jgi:glutathione S-transferase
MFDEEWEKTREGNEFAPSGGKVPVLWDDQAVIWDSLAIVEWLADKTDRDRFWPKDEIARGMARSMAAEMHSGYDNLRRECPMNLRKQFPPRELSENVRAELVRILELWAQARARHGGGGPYLFGTFGAVDIMFAPVVTRFVTYSIPVPRFAAAYMEAMPRPSLAARMGRGGPGGALGDREIRDPDGRIARRPSAGWGPGG